MNALSFPTQKSEEMVAMLPMLVLVVLLVAASEIAAAYVIGDTAIDVAAYAKWALFFVALFTLTLLTTTMLGSIFVAKDYVDPVSRQLETRRFAQRLLADFRPLYGVVVVGLMAIGIVSCSNLNEIYRLTSTHWQDRSLWEIEKPLFLWLKAAEWERIAPWDVLYLSLWPYLFFCMAFLYHRNRLQLFSIMGITIVLMFYLTRAINLAIPTAGPVFFAPDYFQNINEPVMASLQHTLKLYMSGRVAQNGLMPGTMGLPSLHVGLAFIAAVFLRAAYLKSIWVTIPIVLLTWMATVLMGWHYILDGAIGIVVASASWRLSQAVQQKFMHTKL